jgi:hypothetical protein
MHNQCLIHTTMYFRPTREHNGPQFYHWDNEIRKIVKPRAAAYKSHPRSNRCAYSTRKNAHTNFYVVPCFVDHPLNKLWQIIILGICKKKNDKHNMETHSNLAQTNKKMSLLYQR